MKTIIFQTLERQFSFQFYSKNDKYNNIEETTKIFSFLQSKINEYINI